MPRQTYMNNLHKVYLSKHVSASPDPAWCAPQTGVIVVFQLVGDGEQGEHILG